MNGNLATKGNTIFSIDAKKIKNAKKDAWLLLGGGLIAMIFLSNLPPGPNPFFDMSNLSVLALAWFAVVGLTYFILSRGARPQQFAICEKSIAPSLKPWSKMFNKEYFIPYYEIKYIDVERKWGTIYLKDGRKLSIRNWAIAQFLKSEKELEYLEELMVKIRDFVNTSNNLEKEGKSADWRFQPDKIRIEKSN